MKTRTIVTIVLLVVAIPIGVGIENNANQAQTSLAQEPRNIIRPNQADVLGLMNQLLRAISPYSPDNAYFPDLLKEKLVWVWNQNAKDPDMISGQGSSYSPGQGQEQFASAYLDRNNNPRIVIHPLRIWYWVRVQGRVASGFNRMHKNTFALTLAHEAVHLENSNLRALKTRQEKIEEERRTWYKIQTEIVVPFLQAGEPLEIEFTQVDEMLKACDYDPYCQGFVNFVSQHTSLPEER